jgi:hypothetical protein
MQDQVVVAAVVGATAIAASTGIAAGAEDHDDFSLQPS